jgi:FlaA1/EpsC-like NDP-sugar epimerase
MSRWSNIILLEGVLNNVFGTLSVAQAAMATGVSNFVLISTGKAVRPTNVMGTTKRVAELILQAFSREQKEPASVWFVLVMYSGRLVQ